MNKKVFFVINSLKNKAGSERVACLLANLFSDKLNVNITIITRNSHEVAYDLDPKVNIKVINGNFLSFLYNLQLIISYESPDVIIVHNMGKLSLLCSLLRTRAKLISLEHVSFFSRPKYIRFLSKLLYGRFNTIISLSMKDANEYSLWHNNVVHINNLSPFQVDNKIYDITNRNIIAIGRLTEQKNFQHLLYAWEKCGSELNGWNLNIYGIGEEQEKLSNLILERKIQSVNLKGEVKNLEYVYQNSAFLVMSSKYEGLPMVLIEAQSMGLPIISYDCPTGPSEIIFHEKNGLLVENQSVDKLAEAILFLTKNNTKRLDMSNNALSAAERFSTQTILAHWKKIL